MQIRRLIKFAMSNEIKMPNKIPRAPKLLSGELQNFKFTSEHARIYDGYTLDQLYGSKVGIKHSPAVQAEMRKDTIAVILLFAIGFTIIWKLHKIDMDKLDALQKLNEGRLSRQVTLPQGLKNNIKISYFVLDKAHEKKL